jgi:glucose/arabinose dehydrogenase
MPNAIRLFALLTLLMGSSLFAQEPYAPGTFQLPPEVDLQLQPVAVVIPDKFSQVPEVTLNLPPGFSISVFAATSGGGRPRMMAFSPDGVLHVAHSNRILALPDRDGDGVADETIIVDQGLSWTNSIAFYQGDLYAAETDKVIRYRDSDNDLVYEEKEILVDDIPSAGWHTSRAIVFDQINDRFYLAIGSPCDLCRLGKPVSGHSTDSLPQRQEWDAILQFNLDGTGKRIFASGMRNAVGLAIHPATNELWATHNHFDLGGSDIPPEWIDVIREGDFQGYPFAYGYQVWVDDSIGDSERLLPFTAADSALVRRMKQPAGLVPAHQAPLGIHFYDHALFPERYRHAAFVALHGGKVEGNLSVVPGFKVVALFTEPDGSNGKIADFLTGFDKGPNRADIWGKPVGITSDMQGNLYVSSDTRNLVIFKISHSLIKGTWDHSIPDEIPVGTDLEINALVHIERLVEAGGGLAITADLSAFGGPQAVPLEAVDEATYRLQTTLPVAGNKGRRTLSVLLTQDVEGVLHQMGLTQTIQVLPAVDGMWEHNLPDVVVTGTDFKMEAQVRLTRLAMNRDEPQVTADLSAFGETQAVPLVATGNDIYKLEVTLPVVGPSGDRTVSITVVQDPTLEAYRLHFSKTISVLPGGDIKIVDDAFAAGWQVVGSQGAAPPVLSAVGPVYAGQQAMTIVAAPGDYFTNWTVEFRPPEPIDPLGFTGLRFAFHPGDTDKPTVAALVVTMDELIVDLLRGDPLYRVDLDKREWQLIDVPIEAFVTEHGQVYTTRPRRVDQVTRIDGIRIGGNLTGTFYLDDLRLDTPAPDEPPPTAVVERLNEPLENFSLGQNYPNPFNSSTAIRFTLPSPGIVELAIYNLAGQKVATLVEGVRQAGVYTVYWDGRDVQQHELASGLYVYRLRVKEKTEIRKLLLLR